MEMGAFGDEGADFWGSIFGRTTLTLLIDRSPRAPRDYARLTSRRFRASSSSCRRHRERGARAHGGKNRRRASHGRQHPRRLPVQAAKMNESVNTRTDGLRGASWSRTSRRLARSSCDVLGGMAPSTPRARRATTSPPSLVWF